MPLVRVRILLGKSQLAAPARPFAADTSIAHVVSKALEPFADYTCAGLDVFVDAAETHAKLTQLSPSNFEELNLSDIADLGYFWVAHVEQSKSRKEDRSSCEVTPSRSRSSGDGMPNSMESMMQSESGAHVTWPPSRTGAVFEVRIYNALLGQLKAEGLGWHRMDAEPNASGGQLLKTLAKALQYALPFDAKGALARRAMHIPERFTADALTVRAFTVALYSRNPTLAAHRSPLTAPALLTKLRAISVLSCLRRWCPPPFCMVQ